MKPRTAITPATCTKCGINYTAYTRIQKYCAACSALADQERKDRWRLKHGYKPNAERVRELGIIKRVECKKKGAAISLANRFCIGDGHSDSYEWSVSIKFPFTYSLSKNAIYRLGAGGHVFLRREANANRQALTLTVKSAINKAGIKVAQNKLWISILVEKPDARGDAINVVDLVCDAIKDAVGLDDRWFSLYFLDWSIVKDNPHLYITVGQMDTTDVQPCSYCGRLLPFSEYTSNKNRACGIARACKTCTRNEDAERRDHRRRARAA